MKADTFLTFDSLRHLAFIRRPRFECLVLVVLGVVFDANVGAEKPAIPHLAHVVTYG